MPAGFLISSLPVRRISLFVLVALVLGSCAEESRETADTRLGARSTEAAAAARPGIVVDSALPMDTLLRRFQAGLEEPRTLSDAFASREDLTREYLDAVARSDTAALRRMHITRAEYAFLYFPASKMMKVPYELPPEVAWLLLSAESAKGLTSVLNRFGGQRLELQRERCPGEPLREGPNIVWRDCLVRYRAKGEPAREQPLFAAIIERNGRFKFFSYATPL